MPGYYIISRGIVVRFRRNLFISVVAFVLIVYLFKFRGHDATIDTLEICMQSNAHPFADSMRSHDFIKVDQEQTLPFVGNGYIAITVTEDNPRLYVRLSKSSFLPVPINPLIHVLIGDYDHQENIYIDIKSGMVRKLSCFHITEHCSSIDNQILAHRNMLPLLMQKFSLRNPTNVPITMFLSKIKTFQLPDSTYEIKILKGDIRVGLHKSIFRTQPSLINIVVVLVMIPPNKITITANSKWEYSHMTIVKHASVISHGLDKAATDAAINREYRTLIEQANEEMNISINSDSLLSNSHTSTWNKFWISGFGVSISKAQGELNGDKINSTLYYAISTTKVVDDTSGYDLSKQENCYSGHHTRQNKNMWITPTSTIQLFFLIDTWLTTLEKFGCGPLLESGVEGVLQAMILSLGALKFTQRHLEYNIHPKELHRNYYFRNVKYLNVSDLQISVTVGADNKAQLEVKTSPQFGNKNKLYVCDAGCQDQVMELESDAYIRLPVKLTDPLTPILYISQDKKHLLEMKGAIHYAKLAVADPHEQHVISYHKHGNHYGGLPALFWASILLLIIVFHMFLFKLIYNEYCQDSGYIRLRYNL